MLARAVRKGRAAVVAEFPTGRPQGNVPDSVDLLEKWSGGSFALRVLRRGFHTNEGAITMTKHAKD